MLNVKAFELPVLSVPCDHCTGECCKYIALPIDEPETPREFDDIRWYLMHEGIQVFVEDGDWYIQIRTRCRNLQADNRCAVYATRPRICREYKAGECDYTPGGYDYDFLFTEPEQIVEHGRRVQREKRAKARRRRERAARTERSSKATGSRTKAATRRNGAQKRKAS